MPPPARPSAFAPIPDTAVREGSRWRHHRPPATEIADWFKDQPLDEGMEHGDFLGGVLLIPQSEKVTARRADGQRDERYEDVFIPYMQTGTRIAYFRRLAEHRELIPVTSAVEVPRVKNPASAYFNGNMEDGYWWHVVMDSAGQPVRFLCCTMRVALYEPTTYSQKYRGEESSPVLEGRSTKQVAGGPDVNQLAKAQTGAVGRALGLAGILTLGTGVATAEDMLELLGPAGAALPSPDAATLPESVAPAATEAPAADPAEQHRRLREQAVELQSRMQVEAPPAWTTFAAWWQERSKEEGWKQLSDVPLESLKGVVARMERELAEGLANSTPNDPTQAEA